MFLIFKRKLWQTFTIESAWLELVPRARSLGVKYFYQLLAVNISKYFNFEFGLSTPLVSLVYSKCKKVYNVLHRNSAVSLFDSEQCCCVGSEALKLNKPTIEMPFFRCPAKNPSSRLK